MENIDLLSSFVNDALPFAWDDSESSMEFLGEVLVKTNEVVDAVNNCIEAFEETDASLATKADKATTYTKTETDASLATKADKATTYTKTETDASLATKADKATTYTKTETDASLATKALTLSAGAEQTVFDKNKYYPLLSSVAGELILRHQKFYWNGTAWTATNSLGVGVNALQNNTGSYSNGFGNTALYNNTGGSSNGFGHFALTNNTGGSSNGFGYAALYNNTGVSSNGFGNTALTNNTGSSSNGFGHAALTNNTGGSSNGFGHAALRYNQLTKNTAIGDSSYSAFLDKTAGNKTCDYTAIDTSLDRATVTDHGFEATNVVVNVKYSAATGTAIGGLAVGTVYQAKVIDANTIEFVSGGVKVNLTSQGTGTHTFTPQYAYTNTTCLGASTVPNKDNQVVLGDTLVDTVKMGGTGRTPASATATGVKGETCWDANYFYVCVATNTWKRTALSTW